MQNEEGQNMDLYIPRKCSATNRLITSKDHASVQINVGHLDESGRYTGNFSTFALCGFVRAQVSFHSFVVGIRDTGFVAGQAALKAASSKVAKHERACLENQHVFIPFAFDTFGFLAPDAVDLLNRVQKVVYSNVSAHKNQNVVFSRIGFAIQKGVATQLVARLPATSL